MEKAYQENEFGSPAAVDAEPMLIWKVHLVREEPRKLLLILPVVVFSLFVCYLIFRSPLPLVAVLFLYLSSLADYLFPVSYKIDTKGVTVRTLLGRSSIEWNRVKKYYLDEYGIKLSPLKKAGRLEAYRGVYLRFGGRRDEVIEAVKRMRDVIRTDS